MHDGGVTHVVFSSDGSMFATCGEDARYHYTVPVFCLDFELSDNFIDPCCLCIGYLYGKWTLMALKILL